MSATNHIDELVALYALDALTEADRAVVNQHLQTCAACRALIREAQSVVAALPGAIDPSAPSPALKTRLFARVDADLAQRRSALAASRLRDGKWNRAREIAPARDGKWSIIRQSLAPAFVFATLLLVIIFGARVWMLQDDLRTAQAQAALLNDPALRITELPVATAPPNAQARLFSAPQSATAILSVRSLAQLPPTQTYEFWLIRDGKPLRAGIFNVDANGAALLRIDSPSPLGDFQQAGLTIERAGGVDVPTLSALVFVGAIH